MRRTLNSGSVLHPRSISISVMQKPVCGLMHVPHAVTGKIMGNLALSYKELGRLSEAAAMLQKSLDVLKRALAEDHPILGT